MIHSKIIWAVLGIILWILCAIWFAIRVDKAAKDNQGGVG